MLPILVKIKNAAIFEYFIIVTLMYLIQEICKMEFYINSLLKNVNFVSYTHHYESCPSKSWTFALTRDGVPGIL